MAYHLGLNPESIRGILPREEGLAAHVRRVAALAVRAAELENWSGDRLRILEQAALLHHYPSSADAPEAFSQLAEDLGLKADSGDPVPEPVAELLRGLCERWDAMPDAVSESVALIESANLLDEQMEGLPYDDRECNDAIDEMKQTGLFCPTFVRALDRFRMMQESDLDAWSDRLPVFPKAASRALEMLRNPECSLRELGFVVAQDQVLAAEVVRLANSGLHGRSEIARTLPDALVRIGLDLAQKLVASAALRGMFASSKLANLWSHSLDVAAQVSGSIADQKEAYLGGLVHDIGRLLFEFAPAPTRAEFERWVVAGFPTTYAEWLVSGTDHANVGANLLQRWNFSPELCRAIRCHHRPELNPEPLTAAIFASEEFEEMLPSIARDHLASSLLTRTAQAARRAG